MSESDEQARAYDPDRDPDADPDSLNPRKGTHAESDTAERGDTDADPENLNPRTGDQASDRDDA